MALTCAAAVVLVIATSAGGQEVVLGDPQGDSCVRRTDFGADGAFPDLPLPDLISLRYSGWLPDDPENNPYTGVVVPGDQADIFRIELVFNGFVNLPGEDGTEGGYFQYGPIPLLGAIEFDIDRNPDTGGELDGAALHRPLGVAGRFGGLMQDPLAADRMARVGADLDQNFFTEPQYERSGQDFSLVFCGCHFTAILSRLGQSDSDDTFEAGETWIVRGRYWQRAGGYQGVSNVGGGTLTGLYDPLTEVLISHDDESDQTTIVFVGSLTMEGAALLTGQPLQPIDFLIDIKEDPDDNTELPSHHSVEEAVFDLIDAADFGGLTGPERELTRRWRGMDERDVLDPLAWTARAVVGTTYLEDEDSEFVWSDVAFETREGDFNGDGRVDGIDRSLLDSYIGETDGTARDADGVVNGWIVLAEPGVDFTMFDVDGDAVVAEAEIAVLCSADLSGPATPGVPDGIVTGADFFEFVSRFQAQDMSVDLAGPNDPTTPDGILTGADFFRFLDLFTLGCSN